MCQVMLRKEAIGFTFFKTHLRAVSHDAEVLSLHELIAACTCTLRMELGAVSRKICDSPIDWQMGHYINGRATTKKIALAVSHCTFSTKGRRLLLLACRWKLSTRFKNQI